MADEALDVPAELRAVLRGGGARTGPDGVELVVDLGWQQGAHPPGRERRGVEDDVRSDAPQHRGGAIDVRQIDAQELDVRVQAELGRTLECEIFWTVPGGKPIGTRPLDLEAELARRSITVV